MFEIVIERFFPPAPGGRGYSSQRIGGTCETEAEAKIKVASLKNEHTGDYYISYRKATEKLLEVKETGMTYKCPKCGWDDGGSGDTAHVCGPVEIKNSVRITAQEARKLAGPTVQERVDEVYIKIREAATEGKRFINLHDWWATEGYSGIDEYKQACMILEGDGFKVEFVYEERQFVNMYTTVEW